MQTILKIFGALVLIYGAIVAAISVAADNGWNPFM